MIFPFYLFLHIINGEMKHFLLFVTELGDAQRSFAKCLRGLKFECVGDTQTDEERVIFSSFNNFADVITQIEDERDRMVS